MKLSNIVLIGIIAFSTATSALAEGGYGRSLEAVKNFRAKQEMIHGKKTTEVKNENAGMQTENKKDCTHSEAQSAEGKTPQTTSF